MKREFVRNPYNYDSESASNETGLLCKDESLTSQEFIEEADINYIAERFMRTGQMPQLLQLPTYGDFEGTFDFQSSMNLITQAKQEFMKLPAKIRTRFENDPAKLLDFVADKDNYDEAVKLGFIDKEKANAHRRTESPTQAAQDKTGTSGAQPAQGTGPAIQEPGPKAA